MQPLLPPPPPGGPPPPASGQFPSGDINAPAAPRRTGGSRKSFWGPLGMIGLILAKLGGKLAFLVPLLKVIGPFAKTGLTMLLSIWVYGVLYGWQFGLGFVLLIFIHELGHVYAAKASGIRISAPLFIPLFGAQILLRQEIPDAWVEARIGIAGPIAGTAAAGVCHLIFEWTGIPLFAALAYVGYWLNFFNLVPIVPLDGGRVMAAVSPWAWLIGYLLMASWFGWELYAAFSDGPPLGPGSLILAMVLVVSLPRVLRLFRPASPESMRYYRVPLARRWLMAGAYFGLVAVLYFGMRATHLRAESSESHQRDGETVAVSGDFSEETPFARPRSAV